MKSISKKMLAVTIALTLVVSMFLAGCANVPSAVQGAPSGTAAGVSAEASVTGQSATDGSQLSYVSVDINPSIELTLSSGLVLEARGFNDDGAAIILSTDVTGMTPQDAVSALVSSFVSEGYITPESSNTAIVITVAGGQDEGLADSLKQNAEQSLSGLGLNGEVVAASVAEEIVQTANNCGLSIGRYLLLKQVAFQENISLEEAKDKYGTMKMGELLGMIDDVDSFMGDVQQLSSYLDSLTPEQIMILEQARAAYDATMKTVQQTFLAAREQAKKAFTAARDGAKDAFLATKDNDAAKTAKQQIKDAFALAKKTAAQNMQQSKVQARTDFMAAIAALGLDPAVVEQLLEWDLDMNFDFDMDMDFGDGDKAQIEDQDKEEQEDENAAPDQNGANGKSGDAKDKNKDNGHSKGENGQGNSQHGDD